jgi:fimbrial chaperone protein
MFTVFPPQVVLKPRQTQVLRVQWIGPPKLEKELVYRLIAEQLPVELQQRPPQGARINLLLRYEAILYVVPRGAKGALRLVSVAPGEVRDGKPSLAITIENLGAAHGRLVDPKLQLTAAGSGKSVTLAPEQLPSLAGVSVLAGKTRRFQVPWPEALPVGPVTGKISFDMER